MSLLVQVMGFRTSYPQIWHLGPKTVLSQRSLKKWQKQEGHSDLPTSPSFLKQEINVPNETIPSLHMRTEVVLVTGDGNTEPRRLRKLTCYPFTMGYPELNPFVLATSQFYCVYKL